MNQVDFLYYTLGGAILVTMAFGVALAFLVPSLDKWNKRYFITLFSLLSLCAVTCFLALIFYDDPTKMTAERIFYFFDSLLVSVPIFMPTIFLLHSSHETVKHSALFYAAMALSGAYFVMLIVSQFTDVFYYVTAENEFYYGPLFALSVSPLLLVLLLNIAGTVRRKKSLSKKYFVGLLIYLLLMSVTVLVHMFAQVDIFVVFGMVLFALIMYSLILSDNIDKYMRQQREIANQRANIMILQMRPHFIYNSLMGIYYLCDRDAGKAKQVTLDFTTYLRKNFAAIASDNAIPFSEELEHTRAYLSVEQAQFDDSLFVSFDTPHTSFRLPPLTLQPIVENAVVHGMRASNSPIHISVVTRKTDKASEILVEDDGPGFEADGNNEPHIALNNIRERLDMMCGGTLEISPREGGGTSVKVTIPLAKPE